MQKIDWPSVSPDLAPIENVWQLLKMKLRGKNLTSYGFLTCAIKREWKSLATDLTMTLVHSMNSRISEVIKSDGDFI